MYRVKLYKHNLKISIDDDIPKVIEFLTRKVKETGKYDLNISFDISDTTVAYPDMQSLMVPGPYDVVMYMFDRGEYNVPNSHEWSISKNLSGVSISTSTYDDVVGGTWMTIAHELMHCFHTKLVDQGIIIPDMMDVMYIKGVAYPYYKNWTPEALDGNFAMMFTYFSSHWSTIAPNVATSPQNTSTGPSATITRSYDKNETMGILYATNGGATFSCSTLELPWKDNQHSVSCIPKGTYTVKSVFWLKHLKNYYQVQNVPDRSGIFIHTGNYAAGKKVDIKGCILLGRGFSDLNADGNKDIINSTVTLAAFMGFMGGKTFQLTIQ